jgi:hypothetical protein
MGLGDACNDPDAGGAAIFNAMVTLAGPELLPTFNTTG